MGKKKINAPSLFLGRHAILQMVHMNESKKGRISPVGTFLFIDLKKNNPLMYKHSSNDDRAIFIYKLAYVFNSYKDFQTSLDVQTEQNFAHNHFTSKM